MTALESLYREHLGYVLQSLRRLGAPVPRLEDLAHDVFVTVHRRFADFDPSRPVRPWLFGIAHRLVANERALASTKRTGPDVSSELVDEAPGPEEHSERAAAQRLIRRALLELDDEKRAVFIMHELDQIPVSEAAAVLGLLTDTAWSRLKAARKQFKDAMQRQLGTMEGGLHARTRP
jgi:RNA polymerase sigma-70 factor, ECF subfamily